MSSVMEAGAYSRSRMFGASQICRSLKTTHPFAEVEVPRSPIKLRLQIQAYRNRASTQKVPDLAVTPPPPPAVLATPTTTDFEPLRT